MERSLPTGETVIVAAVVLAIMGPAFYCGECRRSVFARCERPAARIYNYAGALPGRNRFRRNSDVAHFLFN